MEYDITLIHIINKDLGGCKYLFSDNLRDYVYALRGYNYVREKDFSSKYLWKHIIRTVKILFSARR